MTLVNIFIFVLMTPVVITLIFIHKIFLHSAIFDFFNNLTEKALQNKYLKCNIYFFGVIFACFTMPSYLLALSGLSASTYYYCQNTLFFFFSLPRQLFGKMKFNVIAHFIFWKPVQRIYISMVLLHITKKQSISLLKFKKVLKNFNGSFKSFRLFKTSHGHFSFWWCILLKYSFTKILLSVFA